MKVGDKVRHIHRGWIGTIAEFQIRNTGVLVNLSDEMGVRFRWIERKNLEVIDEA